MIIKKSIATIAAVGSGLLAWASSALATVPTGLSGAEASLTTIAGPTGANLSTNSGTLPILIGRIINVILGLLGIIFIILIIYSGVTYMTSRGDKEKVKDATKNITNAIIGMVITVAAYAISNYVISALVTATA